jgi:hypothetical protein
MWEYDSGLVGNRFDSFGRVKIVRGRELAEGTSITFIIRSMCYSCNHMFLQKVAAPRVQVDILTQVVAEVLEQLHVKTDFHVEPRVEATALTSRCKFRCCDLVQHRYSGLVSVGMPPCWNANHDVRQKMIARSKRTIYPQKATDWPGIHLNNGNRLERTDINAYKIQTEAEWL